MILDNGNITECSRSNIWLVFGDTVTTPIGNNLRGITRKQLNLAMSDKFKVNLKPKPIKMSKTLKHIERDVKVDEIEQATEAFITSTTRDVWPVCEIKLRDGWSKSFPQGGGKITRQLRQIFAEHLSQHVKSVVF